MVVGGELVALEKLNGCLVQLKHDYFMQELKTLNIFFSVRNPVCQLSNARYLSVFAHKEGTKVVLTITHVLQLMLVRISPAYLLLLPFVHFVLLFDGLEYSLQIEQLKL